MAKEKQPSASLFLKYLNEGQVDKAKGMLNANLYKESYETLCKLIDQGATEISTYSSNQYLFSIMNQWSNDSTMTFVCRFTTKDYVTKYQFNIWFNTIPQDNCIIHLELLDEKKLADKERKHQENNNISLPPPPVPLKQK